MFEFICELSRKQQIAAFCIVYVLWTADNCCKQLCKTSVASTEIQAWVKATKSDTDLYKFIFEKGIIGQYSQDDKDETNRRKTISPSTVKNTWKLLKKNQYIISTPLGYRLAKDPKKSLKEMTSIWFMIHHVCDQSQVSCGDEILKSFQEDAQTWYQKVKGVRRISTLVDTLNSQRITDSPQK